MRVSEILVESKNEEISEAPVGFVSQQLRKAGAGLTSKIPGMGNISARMSGSVEAGNVANNLFKLLHRQFGKTGDTMDTVNANYIANFLKSQGLQPFNLKGTMPLGKSGVEQAILKTVQDNYRGYSNPVMPGAAPAKTAATKPAVAKPVTPKVAAVKKAAVAKPAASGPVSYPQIKQQVAALPDSEREDLLRFLQQVAPTKKVVTPKATTPIKTKKKTTAV